MMILRDLLAAGIALALTLPATAQQQIFPSVINEPLVVVSGGGTGQSSFTPNLPLIGNGTGPIAQGTVSGNTTEFATATGTLTNGHCVSINNGNFIDAGAACTTGGGGGTVTAGLANQLAYYPSNGTTVAGFASGPGSSFLITGSPGVPGWVSLPFNTPQYFDAACGTASHDCTAAMTSCLKSGLECYLPCGTYYLPNGVSVLGDDSAGYGNMRGSGTCSIIVAGTTGSILTLGGSTVGAHGPNRTNLEISNIDVKSSVPSGGVGITLTTCMNCSIRNVTMNDGNIVNGIVLSSAWYFVLDNDFILSAQHDGVLMENLIGGLIGPTTLVWACGNNGFEAAGNVNGPEIQGQVLQCTQNGMEIDTALVASPLNTTFFFGEDADFDTNGNCGLLVFQDSILAGGTSGIVFHGWSSSNSSVGVYMQTQGKVWMDIAGAHIQSNNNAGIFDQDSGWMTVSGSFISFSTTNWGLIGPGVAMNSAVVTGNNFYGNHSGSVAGFVSSASNLCTNNVGGTGGC